MDGKGSVSKYPPPDRDLCQHTRPYFSPPTTQLTRHDGTAKTVHRWRVRAPTLCPIPPIDVSDRSYCPLITPFKAGSEDVDFEAIQAQVARLAAADMGIVLLGTNGEGQSASPILGYQTSHPHNVQRPISPIKNGPTLSAPPAKLSTKMASPTFPCSLVPVPAPRKKPSGYVSKPRTLERIMPSPYHRDTSALQSVAIRRR